MDEDADNIWNSESNAYDFVFSAKIFLKIFFH